MPQCCEKFGSACRAIIFVLGIAGIVMSCLSIVACDFFEASNAALDLIPGEVGTVQIGIFRFNTDLTSCESYPDNANFDAWLTTARICSIIAPCGAGVGLFLIAFECILCKLCMSRACINIAFFIAYMCQALTFCAYGTEDQICGRAGVNCTMGNGSIYGIVAFSVYLIASWAICCSPKPEPFVKGCGEKCKRKKKDDDDEEHGDAADKADEPVPQDDNFMDSVSLDEQEEMPTVKVE